MVHRKENIEKEMFYGASPEIFKRASELRKNMTNAEKALWSALRKKQIQGKKFRRQHPVSRYIVDFYCHQLKLAIEVDGGIHNKTEQKEHDTGRSYELRQLGIKVIRFTNDQIFQNLNEVIKEIEKHMA